jgi:hypothetical protein
VVSPDTTDTTDTTEGISISIGGMGGETN